MDHLDNFITFLRENGCAPARPSDIIADGKWHGFTIEGDAPARKKGYYVLKIDGNFASGACGDRRHGETHQYVGRPTRPLTDAERREWAKRREAEKAQAEKDRAERQEQVAAASKKRWASASPATTHPYLERKAVKAHGIRIDRSGNLMIPMYADNKIWSIQSISADGEKMFPGGGRKKGCYFPIATKDDEKDIIYVCEGYATGASIREATGKIVVVAFDMGNILPVAKTMREKYPDARIIIAGDHDNPIDKLGREKKKTGQSCAIEAAESVNGWYAFPEEQEKDWNDYASGHGLDGLREALESRLTNSGGSVVPDLAIECEDAPPDSFYRDEECYAADMDHGPVSYSGDLGHNFKVLGYNNGHYYYFPNSSRQIVSLPASGHTMANLLQLDSLDAWERRHGSVDSEGKKTSHTKIVTYATNALIRTAEEKGVFIEEDRVRGCGTWIDDGKVVLHTGGSLIVDGNRIGIGDLESRYTYVAAPQLIPGAIGPIANTDAYKLRVICEAATWDNPLSGILLAGWIVVAPICAALEYRPHIWITGEAESGKSTIIDHIIKPVIGSIGVHVHGGTTEPALREMMGYDARPLIYDEAESEGAKQAMIGVIELARKATTGSVVKKFGQRPFKARFCACFSGINPPVNKAADISRISFLVLKKNTSKTAIQDYDDLMSLIENTITPEFSSGLLARTIANMDALLKNITVFQRAARRVIGSARAAQQIGTMLAGVYLLSKTDVCEPEAAEEWIRLYRWDDHTAISEIPDPIRLLQFISSSTIRFGTSGGPVREMTIGDLIVACARAEEDTKNYETALKNFGVLVKDGRVFISNSSPQLARILRDTEWCARWHRNLSDIAGAQKTGSIYFSPGVRSRAISLPVSLFMDDSTARRAEITDIEEEEIPWP